MFLQSYVTRKDKSLDKLFVGVVLVIVIFGFLAFLSASFGLLSRGTGPSFSSVMISQITFGLLPGLFFAFLLSKLHYTFWRRVAFFIFLFSVGLNLLLLVPAISLEHGGATRWLQIAGFTFQPSEFLKIAFILYFGSWLASAKDKIKETIFGVVPFLFILSITVGILIFERDTDTAVVITFTALAMYFISGARWRDIFIIFFIGMAGLASLFYIRPYLMDRLMTFLVLNSEYFYLLLLIYF
jgi:cell division protein FtsW